MVAAVTARAATDATFRSRVAAAVLRVLNAKATEGLLATRLAATGTLRATDGRRPAALARPNCNRAAGRRNDPRTAEQGRQHAGRYLGAGLDGRPAVLPRDVPRWRVNLEQQDRKASADVSGDSALTRTPWRPCPGTGRACQSRAKSATNLPRKFGVSETPLARAAAMHDVRLVGAK